MVSLSFYSLSLTWRPLLFPILHVFSRDVDTNYTYSTQFSHLLSGCCFYSSAKPVFSKDMRAMLLSKCFWTGLSPWTVLWTITHGENLLHACLLWHFLSPSLLNFHSVTSSMTPPFHCSKSFLPYYILNTVRQEIAYSSLTFPPKNSCPKRESNENLFIPSEQLANGYIWEICLHLKGI